MNKCEHRLYYVIIVVDNNLFFFKLFIIWYVKCINMLCVVVWSLSIHVELLVYKTQLNCVVLIFFINLFVVKCRYNE